MKDSPLESDSEKWKNNIYTKPSRHLILPFVIFCMGLSKYKDKCFIWLLEFQHLTQLFLEKILIKKREKSTLFPGLFSVFSTSDRIYQMCYCCRKLENLQNCGGRGYERPNSASHGLSRPLTCEADRRTLSLSQSNDWKQGQRLHHRLGLTRERP